MGGTLVEAVHIAKDLVPAVLSVVEWGEADVPLDLSPGGELVD